MRPLIGKIVVLLLMSGGLLYIQLWIVRTLFPNAKEKERIFWYAFFISALIAGLLLAFHYLIQPQIAIPEHLKNIVYSAFIAISGGILALLFVKQKQRRPAFFVATLTIIAIITGSIERLLAGSGIGLLILKATGEEILKTAGAQSLTSHMKIFKSDIIIMSVLIGFGFAFFENITYFVSSGSVGQFFIRSLTVSLLHAIFSGIIGWILWKRENISYRSFLIAYAGGICIHILYNLSMEYIPTIGGITFFIGGYILLTYLLYKSDRLYLAE